MRRAMMAVMSSAVTRRIGRLCVSDCDERRSEAQEGMHVGAGLEIGEADSSMRKKGREGAVSAVVSSGGLDWPDLVD